MQGRAHAAGRLLFIGLLSLGLLSVMVPAAGAESGAAAARASRVHAWRTRHELDAAESLLRHHLAKLLAGEEIRILREPDRLTLRVPASLLFDADSTQLRPESLQQPVLTGVLEVLRRRSRLDAQINVFTDAIGGEIANHGLTEQRLLALLTALRENRIRPARLSGTGMGAADEIADDATPESRERNRRVEVVFSLP